MIYTHGCVDNHGNLCSPDNPDARWQTFKHPQVRYNVGLLDDCKEKE